MILKDTVIQLVESFLANTEYYLVDLKISKDNSILVEIDSFRGVSIDFCVELNRHIEANLDRETEDYELEVSSAGLTEPFKVLKQYEKNIGNEVEVFTKDNKKMTGILISCDEIKIVLQQEKTVKPEGAKRKMTIQEDTEIPFTNIKTTKYIIRFK
ncbi:MAG TPA: ribosome assembly cofactor RimP [Paludibacteraceae bacterium]|nr:ribosome assembly cofactor RimP [Paludibacteraceae bacterium]HPT43405.1 ribosome assembly cofactor RimP [Paludibacteraceae bacterium]